MKRCYILIKNETGEIVGYTLISDFDTDRDMSDEEILAARLEAAISDGVMLDESYTWQRDSYKTGILL